MLNVPFAFSTRQHKYTRHTAGWLWPSYFLWLFDSSQKKKKKKKTKTFVVEECDAGDAVQRYIPEQRFDSKIHITSRVLLTLLILFLFSVVYHKTILT